MIIETGIRQIMEIPEYFVYFGIFMMHRWDKRSSRGAKRLFCLITK